MPATQVRPEVIVDALQVACRAPSPDNSQPWRWVATDHTVELFADPAHLVRVTDATVVRFPDPAAPPDWDRLAAILNESVRAGMVRVEVIADEFRGPLAEASQLAETLRLYDSGCHIELSWWTADFVTNDEILYSSLTSAAESDRVDVGRTFPVVAQPERRTEIHATPPPTPRRPDEHALQIHRGKTC